MAGDFNAIRFPEEHSKGGSLNSVMRRFFEVLEDLELRDLPLHGGIFTWNGGRNNHMKSRLDRFLISEEWEDLFSGPIQSLLPRPMSNHHPILLDGGGMRRGPTLFRFENVAEGGGVLVHFTGLVGRVVFPRFWEFYPDGEVEGSETGAKILES